jgi:hypothetical protein
LNKLCMPLDDKFLLLFEHILIIINIIRRAMIKFSRERRRICLKFFKIN